MNDSTLARSYFDFLGKLCLHFSPAGCESIILPILLPKLQSLGAEIKEFDVGGGRYNIQANWGSSPDILFSTHLDVVPPNITCTINNSYIQGRGACDAKGQIAAQLGAIERLLQYGYKNITWVGVVGEESDSVGAKAFLSEKNNFSACKAIIVGEPTNCKVARGQKGFLSLILHCKGKTAHGGTPELGKNAILTLMDWILTLRTAQPSTHDLLGKEVWNLGTLTGGRAANVVADEAQSTLCIRTLPGNNLRRTIEKSKPDNGEIHIVADETHHLYNTPPGFSESTVPFGSDLAIMRDLQPKAAAILSGPGDPTTAHTDKEILTFIELEQGIQLFYDLACYYLDQVKK